MGLGRFMFNKAMTEMKPAMITIKKTIPGTEFTSWLMASLKYAWKTWSRYSGNCS